jgi:hypothetical protein
MKWVFSRFLPSPGASECCYGAPKRYSASERCNAIDTIIVYSTGHSVARAIHSII